MNKQYAAMVMRRVPLNEGDYLFYADHVELGDYDKETMSFTDRDGNLYYSMMSPYAVDSRDNYYFYYLLDLIDYEKQFNLKTRDYLEMFLDEFQELAFKKIFYLGRKSDNQYGFVTIDKEKIFTSSMGITNREGNTRYGDNYLIDLELQQMLGEVYDEKYSKEELIKLSDKLSSSNQEIENLIKIIKNYAMDKDISELVEDKSTEKIDIDELYNKVTKTLIAQDEPAKRVITEIARKEMDIRKKREGILLTGPTGIGKTELMRLISKNINRPFYKVDSTQLTMPGFVGKDIEEVLWDLYEKCGRDKERAEQAIIFFDEIDKKGSSSKSDVSGQGVLNVLLPFIEGSTYDACPDTKYSVEKVSISTDNMIVILGGAFMDVYKNVARNHFGFLKDNNSREEEFTTKKFVDCGMMTDEFMSRVTVIPLNELDVDSIKRIMLESDESAMKIQQEIFDKLGVKLTFTDSYTTKAAQNAYEKKTGARGLNGIIDESTWRAFNEVYSHPNMYDEAILDEDTLENPSHYQLVKKK